MEGSSWCQNNDSINLPEMNKPSTNRRRPQDAVTDGGGALAVAPCSQRWFVPAHLEEELGAFLHDLLDLQEAGGVHEQELVPHRHAKTARVTEGQNLLEALGLHSRRELHHSRARLTADTSAAVAVAEKVPEIRTASSQHSSMGLGRKQRILHSHLRI